MYIFNQQFLNPTITETITLPFPQAFIIIEGQDYAKISEIVHKVTAGKAYYILPGYDHILWTKDGATLQLIYLAWGEKTY